MNTFIHINQYNIGKQCLEKKAEDVDKKISDVSSLVTTTVLNTKIIGLIKKQIMMLKHQKLRKNIPLLLVTMNLRVTYLMQGKKKKN